MSNGVSFLWELISNRSYITEGLSTFPLSSIIGQDYYLYVMVHSSSGKTKDLSTKALSLNGIGEGDLKGDFRVVYDVSRRHAMSEFVFQLESSSLNAASDNTNNR